MLPNIVVETHSHSPMRGTFTLISSIFLLTFLTLPVQAQQSPARKLAELAEKGSPSDSLVSKCRSRLNVAARFSSSRSSVSEALTEGVEKLRKKGLYAPVLRLLSVDGLSGLVRRERPFEEVLDTYLKYRIKRGFSHEGALEKMKPY